MKLIDIQNIISKIPIAIKGNKEALICLDGNITICNGKVFISLIDDKNIKNKNSNFAIVEKINKCKNRFPAITIKEAFWECNFNKYLFKNYDLAKELFLNQSKIKDIIIQESKQLDFIVLLLVDGLSFIDCLKWKNTRPCLVDTITITDCGFKNIVGWPNKTIAYYLLEKGFNNFIGYSYWDRTNELTDHIFKYFKDVNKVQSFAEILGSININKLNKTFIQIVLNGLDGIAHTNRDEPLIEAFVENIYSSINNLRILLKDSNKRGKIYLISDHGILWKHKSDLVKIDPDITNNIHTRYYSTVVKSPRGKSFPAFNSNFTSLQFPYLNKNLKSNEWGVHGGISLEESIIPFLEWIV